ncbi:MAG: transcription-repair coupling factor [Pirellulaceae bacterium]|nr:transcription-repair coupling factor [Pirellulaceae bacterium]
MPEIETKPTASQQLMQLRERLLSDAGFDRVAQTVTAGQSATLDGVCGSSCALVAAALVGRTDPAPVVLICPRSAEIDHWVDDLTLFSSAPVLTFPALENRPGTVLQDDNFGDRLRTLKKMLHGPTAGFVVASVQSLLQPSPEREAVQRHSRLIRGAETLDVETLAKWLTKNRFHATSAVELPGEFSIRGGILDVFAWDWADPVRIELFDDQIDSIRRFDVATQRSLEPLDQVEITVLGGQQGGRGCLTDYLPMGTVCVFVEPDQIQAEAKHLIERTEDPSELFSYTQLSKKIRQFGSIHAAGLASGREAVMERLPVETVERFSGDIARVRQELDNVARQHQVFLIAETQAEIKRLGEILAPTEVATANRLHFVIGRLRSGFHLASEQVLVVSGNELFHRTPLRRASRNRAGKAIESFLDLRQGDLVVHLAHGIGRYRGLQLIRKEEQVEEHLEIEFHGGTKIFVPATKIELVQKYVGARKSRPRLATIGGKNWVKQKKAAAEAVEDLAADLLELQAERESRPGISFAIDTEWQQEFDASFPYTETDDQLVSVDAIKIDMQKSRPMDRLICGDVGFGKTELAMRAAFKAIDNGYQVAMLVPTTILAEQHYHTFRERMSEFPFTIEKLSRFCSSKEQRETVAGLKEGRVDIVIGTHRLASRDVSFSNLGLLVIDEEQRFGVEVKERLKTMRSTIDVLTLSATPIPRTLHMSLTGIRDISNLETPPEDRVAVDTRVTRWSHELIRNAIMRELSRDGQVYFVHNRIHDIEALAQKLKFIVPEATIEIGHGQMPEGQLEQVMVDFVNHQFDVLLATTIVESGLDIPNANTIFIDDADRYGLADLHQLRGRVGRYKHRAYCYMLVDPDKAVNPNAARRLRAIEEFSDMGAGFSIAMRDLEIRGAGNVLGTQQSGHIAQVGYELYCQLLEAAVRRKRNLPPKLSADVNIELPGAAYIPRSYVEDIRTKIDLYRRLARSVGDDELKQLRQEFLDRFGPPPESVERLLQLTQLKTDAAFWQVSAIQIESPYLVFHFGDLGRARQLVKASNGRLRIVDDQSIYLTLPNSVDDPDQIIETVKSVLRAN